MCFLPMVLSPQPQLSHTGVSSSFCSWEAGGPDGFADFPKVPLTAGAAGGGPRLSGCSDRAWGPQAQEVAHASLPSPLWRPGPALSLLGDAPGDAGLPPCPSSHALPPFGVLG